jgi:methylphosphotriester-DNA--protein-cysteine methyltransferase
LVKHAALRLISIVALAAGIVLLASETRIQAFPFTTVYIVRPGRFYHRHNCLVIRNNPRPIAISVSNAREQGFYPCKRCNPPTW